MDEKILIVDDSPFIVDGLVAILKRKGYRPVPAHGGDEALSLLKSDIPDLILLDIMMEPMDGWETLDHIRADPAYKDIPVLMFSAKKITPVEAEAHSMNIDDFISKPVNPTQLLESIQRIFFLRNDLKMKELVAQNAGLDKAVIDEYMGLRKNIEVDRNLLAVLKNATGMNTPGREVPGEDIASIKKLEEKITASDQRLKEISEQFTKTV
jgi:CheY-like chemotaxis protein